MIDDYDESSGWMFFWYRLTWVFPDKFHRAVKRLCVCVLLRDVLLIFVAYNNDPILSVIAMFLICCLFWVTTFAKCGGSCVCHWVSVLISVCMCICQAGPTTFELHGMFVDVEQQIGTQRARQPQLLKALQDTQAKTIGQYNMTIMMMMTMTRTTIITVIRAANPPTFPRSFPNFNSPLWL